MAGWRLSRLGYRVLGRPQGALTWPLGLALLTLNAETTLALDDIQWAEQCLSGLIDRTGRWLLPRAATDQGGLGYAALRLFELTGREHYCRAATELGRTYLAQPGADRGCIPYTSGRHEVLVDTVAFICPFLARLSRLTGDDSYLQLALAQLEAMWEHGQADNSWCHHAFDSRDFRPVGNGGGWGRGVGWLLMGLTDTVMEAPDIVPTSMWLGRALGLLTRLEKCQRPDGHWPWRLDCQQEEPDSSVTALMAYSLARLRQSYHGETRQYASMLDRCRQAIDAVTDNSGRIMQGSGEAKGIGAYSTHFGHYLWAQAPAVATDRILAGS